MENNFFRLFFAFVLCGGIFSTLSANRYDYLLFSNNYADVRKGVDLGANVNSRLRGSTPLYDASRKNNTDILYLLLKRGAKVNAISHGETALHKVVQFNNLNFTQILLKAGANPNIRDSIRGNTALHYAVASRNSQMISLLLSYGADITITNSAGDTPARYVLSNVSVPSMQAQNKHILLSTTPFRVGSGSVNIMVQNLTESFITITYGALYMNGNLISEQSFSRKIPPHSSVSVGSLPISQDSYENVSVKRSGIATVKYGFGLEYEIEGRAGNFYQSAKAQMQVW